MLLNSIDLSSLADLDPTEPVVIATLVSLLGLGSSGFCRNNLLEITCNFTDSEGATISSTIPALEEGKLLYIDNLNGCSLSDLQSDYALADLATEAEASEAINFLGWPQYTPPFLELDKTKGFWIMPASGTALSQARVLNLVGLEGGIELEVVDPASDEQAYPLTKKLVYRTLDTSLNTRHFPPMKLPDETYKLVNKWIKRQQKVSAKVRSCHGHRIKKGPIATLPGDQA